MPVPLPPTPWALSAAPDDHPDDLWALGADLAPATLVSAYRLALFPMPVAGLTGWFSPVTRAVLPLASFHASRRLHRTRRRFDLRVDTAFAEVVRACADPSRPGGWIDEATIEAYVELHALGWAHSVEAWDAEGLAGGVYGVAIGGLFAAESMFTRRRDASKVALWGLVEHLRSAGDAERRLVDAQWPTPHLASLGGRSVSRAEYRRLLEVALAVTDPFAAGR